MIVMSSSRSSFAALLLGATLALILPRSAAAQAGGSTLPHYAGCRADAPIPRPGMTLLKGRVALLVTDPQRDFLSPDGVAWGVGGESVKENHIIENIDRLIAAAKGAGIQVFVSPHYYYPQDHQWKFGGALEALMHKGGMFDRTGPLTQEGFAGSGTDWLERYKRYIDDGQTVVSSPHKVFGPESNDLVLQLRKADVRQVILAGTSANLCTESHMREVLEQGSRSSWSPTRPRRPSCRALTATRPPM
jgi:nicotinamidase-related amidase